MAITRAQIARQLLMEGGLLRKNFQTGDLAARDDSYGTVSAPDAVTGGGNDYYDQRFQTVVSPPQSQTGQGPYDDNETILSNILGGIGSRVDKVGDRIRGFGTGVKNYLSDPSNRRGLLSNIALTSLFGPLGLLFSGLARTSKFQDMLSNLKGDDLLQGTNTIDFDDPINKDVLKFINPDKQITDSPYPDIDARQANFQSTPFYLDNVIPVKNYTKQDLEKLGAKKGFLGSNEQLEELQKYYDSTKKITGPGGKFQNDPVGARQFIKDQSEIPFGGGLYDIDMDLIPKDFLETQKDLKEQISPTKLFIDT